MADKLQVTDPIHIYIYLNIGYRIISVSIVRHSLQTCSPKTLIETKVKKHQKLLMIMKQHGASSFGRYCCAGLELVQLDKNGGLKYFIRCPHEVLDSLGGALINFEKVWGYCQTKESRGSC